MAAPNLSLTSLAATISASANALSDALENGGFPTPSFDEGGLEEYPKTPELMALRLQLLDTTTDMYRLALGPNDHAFMMPLFLNYDATILDVLNQFDFWSAVPLGGSATYTEIANKVNLPESLVRRVVKYAIPIRAFARAPDAPDSVIHTSLSAAPVKQRLLQSWLRHNFEEIRPSALHLSDAFRKYSAGKEKASDELLETGFALANIDGLDKPEHFWDYLMREEEGKPEGYRATKFAGSMQAASNVAAVKAEDVITKGYDWSKLGDATVVDVGGSSGHDAIRLAQKFPNLKRIIVQDLPKVEAAFNDRVPEELRSRISFTPHDFFEPQDTKGDVYMMKFILHDWPDKYAAKILKNIVPQLRKDSRIILVEVVAAPDGTPQPLPILDRMHAAADLQMLCSLNSLERTK